jgi:hypothetical protein
VAGSSFFTTVPVETAGGGNKNREDDSGKK